MLVTASLLQHTGNHVRTGISNSNKTVTETFKNPFLAAENVCDLPIGKLTVTRSVNMILSVKCNIRLYCKVSVSLALQL